MKINKILMKIIFKFYENYKDFIKIIKILRKFLKFQENYKNFKKINKIL